MGLEFIYAYLENIFAGSVFLSVIFAALLIVLIVFRCTNDLDKDDWIYLMMWTTPLFFFFLFLTMAPGMDHIKDVKLKVVEINNEAKIKEMYQDKTDDKETPTIHLSPSSCHATGLCEVPK